MFGFIFKKIFGSKNDRYLRRLRPIVARINALEPQMQELADEDFAQRMAEYRRQVQAGERTLDDLLPEVFALIREASRRVMGMRHYDVQLVGGIVLHRGKIAEMKTGEGKTLVATLPVALNALSGKGVHVVTVNDYLATRDAQWMGKLYNFLGLSVGVIVNGLDDQARKEAYGADITYGTNNEFGFDYLRDNMKFYATQLVQRGHSYAIVDEVDSILIDEARTPLIISGASDESVGMYRAMDQIVRQLGPEDYTVDEKARTAMLSEEGVAHCEALLHVDNLFDPANITQQHCILQALKAHHVFKRDVDYIVQNDKVVIVDEFTGRLMDGRRYSDGLHQALEAKENVTIAAENQTLASITFQNYFRMYDKLAGMTGTADTEAVEFHQIYNLEVVSIPPNKPMQRRDYPDLIYRTRKEKYDAIIEAIRELYEKGQPVLVGTISIEKSEELSAMLKKRGIKHNVLNAKFHEKEAEIVAQAGKLGAVTVATNMAGRGTDIMLGGNAEYLAKAELRKAGLSDELIAESTGYADTDNEEILNARKMFAEAEAKYKDEIKAEADQVRAAGGLFILGTERHESRRIDNQLRGRAGRQGDPGESRFYLSLEDDIMRLFGSERVMGMMEKLGVDEDTPIDAKILSNAIENAQKQVESRNFQTRKTVLEYDDVMNTQRKVIYEQRRKVLDGENLKESVQAMLSTVISTEVQAHMGELKHMDAENWREVCAQFRGLFLRPDEFKFTDEELQQYDAQALTDLLQERASDIYARKEAELGEPLMRELERVMMLRVVDEYWMDNIDAMQELRQGIGLRAYGQNDPVVAYKKEGYEMFESMIAAIQAETIRRIFLARVQVGATTVKRERVAKVTGESAGSDGTVKKQPVKKGQKVGRNDPCPCGSGKKYKKCCGMHEDE